MMQIHGRSWNIIRSQTLVFTQFLYGSFSIQMVLDIDILKTKSRWELRNAKSLSFIARGHDLCSLKTVQQTYILIIGALF